MKKINCFGEICPIPLLILKQNLVSLEINESVMIVVDHSCVVQSIEDYYQSSQFEILLDEVLNGVWEITATRLY